MHNATNEEWHASLSLKYDRTDWGTVLRHKSHEGPLRVQKALYPEGREVCHTLLLHPPGGIVGGDNLRFRVRLEEKAHVLFTNPGASKWYRNDCRPAYQTVQLHVGSRAVLEWFPQETIFFDRCWADMTTEIELESGAAMIGWDVFCFGRHHSGESFTRGQVRSSLKISRDGRVVLLDRARFDAQEPVMKSLTGLSGHTVTGTLVACAETLKKSAVDTCRKIPVGDAAQAGITLVDGMFIARILGDSSVTAKSWFTEIWRVLRPQLLGRSVERPRIWRT